jgi:CheY-like chemotaxis protein
MNNIRKSGPIIVIEDDVDDQQLLDETFKKLNYPYEIIFFSDGFEALAYIEKTEVKPFLILSDVNMPVISGFELRKKICASNELSIRCIPYLFFTSGANKKGVYEAYEMSAQGFFIKPNSMAGLEEVIRKIIDYWQVCFAPSQYLE